MVLTFQEYQSLLPF